MFGESVSMSAGAQTRDFLILELLEKTDDFSELSYTDWVWNLAFAVDTLTDMKEQNHYLHGEKVGCCPK